MVILISSNLKAQDSSSQATLPKVKEYGVGFTGLNSFSLQYRWGNEKRLFRINATIGGSTAFGKNSGNLTQAQDTMYRNNNTYTSKTTSPVNFNSSLSFSILKIKYVADKFGFMYGGVVGVSYSTTNTQATEAGTNVNYSYNNANNTGLFPYSETTKNHSQIIQPYAGVILGVVYKINSSFLVYLEIAPNIYYARNNTTITDDTNNKQPNQYVVSQTQKTANNTFGIANLTNSGAMLTVVYRITK